MYLSNKVRSSKSIGEPCLINLTLANLTCSSVMAAGFFVSLLILQFFVLSLSLDNGLVGRPPMGWMSWARFTCQVDCSTYPDDCINEKLFRDMANELVQGGFLEAGEYSSHRRQ